MSTPQPRRAAALKTSSKDQGQPIVNAPRQRQRQRQRAISNPSQVQHQQLLMARNRQQLLTQAQNSANNIPTSQPRQTTASNTATPVAFNTSLNQLQGSASSGSIQQQAYPAHVAPLLFPSQIAATRIVPPVNQNAHSARLPTYASRHDNDEIHANNLRNVIDHLSRR